MSGPKPLRSFLVLALFLLGGTSHAGPVYTHDQVSGFFSSPFPTGGSATVSGAAKLVGGAPYTGEGYVVGPVVNGQVVPYTLTSYNGLDYLINDRFGSGSDRITVLFDFPIYSLSFDYEIFPNANVPDGRGKDPNTTRGWPDFTLKADGQLIFRTLAVMPGAGTFGYTSSPNHKNEYAPQFVGSSGLLLFPNGVTKLEFIDWPPVIGVNNVQFGTNPPTSMPEPATMALFGLCAAGAGVYGFRRRKPVVA